MAPPIKTRPSFPFSQSLPSGSFHKPLTLLHQKGRYTENHNHRKLTNLITRITAFSNSRTLWAMPSRAIQDGQVMVESTDKRWSMEKGMANYFSTLALRTPWTVWKGKKIGHWKMNVPGQCMLLEMSGEITPESKNNTQLWMWLVMKIKSDVVKSNNA